MSDIVSPLLQWLNANPELAGLATFVVSASESVAIIGTIVPGSITMTAIGTLAGAGIIPLWSTILWAMLGAIVGDGISYWIGHYFKNRLRSAWPFKNNPAILKRGETFVHKYGVMSVFIGRFVGPVRALVPLVAGMLGMRPVQFTLANITSAIGWAPAYMLPGILLGAASLELPPDVSLHVISVLFIIGLTIVLCIWSMIKLFQLIHHQTSQIQDSIWRSMKKTRYASTLTVILKHHNANKTHGQLSLAMFFVLTCIIMVLVMWYVKVAYPVNLIVNDTSFHLFRGIRSPVLDSVMMQLTLLGQKQVMLPVMAVVITWLYVSKNRRAALHLLMLAILVTASVYLIKNSLHIERPWGIAANPETYSMPSGHTTIAVTFYLLIAFFITRTIKPSNRWPIFAVAFTVAVLVSISRLYLGAHWFTDVFCAWLLGFAILMVVIISYHRKREDKIHAKTLFLVTILSIAVILPIYSISHSEKIKAQYALIDWPSVNINIKEWWQNNHAIPAYRSSLFGFPSQKINIEWVGNLNQIRETLLKQGWSKPPARDWISTMHRIADISSTQYLPLVSPQYLDRKPMLILTRRTNNQKNLLVIRLWDSNRVTDDSRHETLWVGVIGLIPRSYSWIFKRHASDVDVSVDKIFTQSKEIHWDAKTMDITLENGKKKRPITNTILLIKPTDTRSKKH